MVPIGRVPEHSLTAAGPCEDTATAPSSLLVAQLTDALQAEEQDVAAAACAALAQCCKQLAQQPVPWWASAAELQASMAAAIGSRPWLLSATEQISPDASWTLPGALALVGITQCESEGAAALPAALVTLRPVLLPDAHAAMAAAARSSGDDVLRGGSGGGGGAFAAQSAAALLLALGRTPAAEQLQQEVRRY